MSEQNLKYLSEEVRRLRHENMLLKATIKEGMGIFLWKIPDSISLDDVPGQDIKSWAERSEHFDRIRSNVLSATVIMVKTLNRAVHTDDIMVTFKNKFTKVYNEMTNPHETIPRRLRELKGMQMLASPKPGYWFIGPKLKELADGSVMKP